MVNPIISKAFNKNREELIGKAVLKRFLYRLDTQLFEKFVAAIASFRVRHSTRLFVFNCHADQVLYQTQMRSREY